MTRIPVEQVRVGKGLVPTKKHVLAGCAKPGCEYLATDTHHIVRRSFLAGPYDLVEIDGTPRVNICGLCWLCHQEITTNKAQILWDENVWAWCDNNSMAPLDAGLGLETLPPLPTEEEVSVEREPETVERIPSHAPGFDSVGTEPSRSITPGEPCPTCDRRVPHEKKASSPTNTAQFNLGKGPADTVERVKERLNDFCELAGVQELPYARLKALDLLLVLGSQVRRETLQNVIDELGWAA